MPRHTLDKWTYKLKTISVCITKHKEEDIYNHMVKMYEKMEELYEKYDARYRNILRELDDEENHMYAKYNWRLGDPSRFWLKNADNWYCIDETEEGKEIIQQEYKLFYEIWADFYICDKYSDWIEEKPEWSSMVIDIERWHDLIKNIPDTIKIYEQVDYFKYKKRWQEADKDWIAEQEREKDHNKNHPKIDVFVPITDFDNEPPLYPLEPLIPDCIYCKQHWEERKVKYDRSIQFWLKNKKEYEEYLKQKEQEDQAKRLKREKAVQDFVACFDLKEDLECTICDYKAQDSYDLHEHKNSASHKKNCRYCKVCNLQCRTDQEYDDHLETLKHKNKEDGIEEKPEDKEDKKKSRYCEVCQLQCRTDKEYQNHIDSKRHKQNAGLLEKVKIYKCNHCDYQTTIKCNYEKHIVSKNHQ